MVGWSLTSLFSTIRLYQSRTELLEIQKISQSDRLGQNTCYLLPSRPIIVRRHVSQSSDADYSRYVELRTTAGLELLTASKARLPPRKRTHTVSVTSLCANGCCVSLFSLLLGRFPDLSQTRDLESCDVIMSSSSAVIQRVTVSTVRTATCHDIWIHARHTTNRNI